MIIQNIMNLFRCPCRPEWLVVEKDATEEHGGEEVDGVVMEHIDVTYHLMCRRCRKPHKVEYSKLLYEEWLEKIRGAINEEA